ncbi:alpha-1,2-fucosyltransferase [Providencia sp. M-27]|uniref:alpha-1,2-fucosyltransferase n=1 Tax=Providencia sp. M-27 TaxID=2713150 RepID=UPI00140A5FB1|nr:alpha-1,2-fucosyltransferase [Providencia sp. M-27]
MKKITIDIEGGLGNQLFQFAFALNLYSTYNNDLILNISSFSKDELRNFELDKIIDLHKLNYIFITDKEKNFFEKLMYKISKKLNTPILGYKQEENLQYKPLSKANYGISSYKGYWQSPHYFSKIRNIILELVNLEPYLTKKLLTISNFSKNNINISLHVRRGDYVENMLTNSIHGTLSNTNYYKQAINYFENKFITPHFFIFSDDIKWCKEEFDWLKNKTFVDYTESHFEDLSLMTLCDHNIIANSTFSWWGAYLNSKDNIVIAPKNWFNNNNKIDIYPDSWILY